MTTRAPWPLTARPLWFSYTRDGRFAQVYWAYADDTLEERIAAVVCRRILSMKGMVGDDVQTLREIEALLVAPE